MSSSYRVHTHEARAAFHIRLTCIFIVLILVILFAGCGQEGAAPTEPQQQPTNGVTAVGPVAAGAALHPTLIWHKLSGASDSTTYDVYLGTANNPPLVKSDLSDTTYYAGALQLNTRYYWSVVSHDGVSTKRSATFQFVTKSSLAQYPLALNDHWEYRHQTTISSSQLNLNSLRYYTLDVTDVDPTWSLQPAYVMRAISADFDNVEFDSSMTYFYQSDSALLLLGYDGTGAPVPTAAKATAMPCTFNGHAYGSVDELLSGVAGLASTIGKTAETLEVENPPLKGLSLPLSIGKQWVYRDSIPWHIDKKVTAYQILDVPAWRYGAFVIKWLIDMDDDGQPDSNATYYDYVSETGLVKRTTLLEDVEFVNPQTGKVIIADILDVYELLACDVR